MVDTSNLPKMPKMSLELVPVPVSDIDRAIEFYDKIFGNKRDTQITPEMRVVQFTPPGSSCAIVFGTGMGPITEMKPGSVRGLHLVVEDVEKAREAITKHGIEVEEIQGMGGVKYAWFSDPDGNLWGLQQWPEGYNA